MLLISCLIPSFICIDSHVNDLLATHQYTEPSTDMNAAAGRISGVTCAAKDFHKVHT